MGRLLASWGGMPPPKSAYADRRIDRRMDRHLVTALFALCMAYHAVKLGVFSSSEILAAVIAGDVLFWLSVCFCLFVSI